MKLLMGNKNILDDPDYDRKYIAIEGSTGTQIYEMPELWFREPNRVCLLWQVRCIAGSKRSPHDGGSGSPARLPAVPSYRSLTV